MPPRGFVLKTKDFEETINLYKLATKKDLPYILNRALRNVGFKAAEFTPKKDPGQIEAELREDKIGLKMVTKKLRGRIGSTYQTRKGRTKTIKKVTRKQISLRTRQLISRRKKRVGFLRAGWVAALQHVGLARSIGKDKTLKDGKSQIGRGKLATTSSAVASLSNLVYGRLDGKARAQFATQMRQALAKAMDVVSKDMTIYATEKLFNTAAKYSARRGKKKMR